MANYCSNCGATMLAGNTKCFECGAVTQSSPNVKTIDTVNTVGNISLITGIVGFFIFGIPLGITSIILGIKAIDSSAGKIGLTIGIIDVVAVILFLGAM